MSSSLFGLSTLIWSKWPNTIVFENILQSIIVSEICRDLLDKTRFRLVIMFFVSTMDDLEILYERKHYVYNDTGLGPTKD